MENLKKLLEIIPPPPPTFDVILKNFEIYLIDDLMERYFDATVGIHGITEIAIHLDIHFSILYPLKTPEKSKQYCMHENLTFTHDKYV